ncbi:MAG: very short patch repair endonuclease [Solirubrobacterales bacterium]
MSSAGPVRGGEVRGARPAGELAPRRLPPAPRASSATARKVMQGNRSDSRLEQALRSELHRRGLRFRKHLAVLPGVRCRPDIVFTRDRVAVFVDGCFWHSCPLHGTSAKANGEWWAAKLRGNVERDRRNDEALQASGWRVVRLWGHEPLEAMADTVLSAIGRPSAD